MHVKAHYKFARMSPRKIRVLREAVRGLPAEEALVQLGFMPGKAAQIIRQTLKSAVANAEHNHELTADSLRVADVIVNEGFTLKRFMPVSRGMAHPILKRTSHVTVVVEGEPAPKKKKGRRAAAAGIETITAEQHLAAGGDHDHEHEEGVPEKNEKDTGRTGAGQTKQEAAHEIKKMQQQGGDKVKTHRRKSLGGE